MSTHSHAAAPPPLPPAAVLYTPASEGRSVLADFAGELKGRGWRVGGLIQEVAHDEAGQRTAIVAVEVDSARRIPLTLPAAPGQEGCLLDPSALAEASGALRRAVGEGMDLVVVEKFGEREQAGEGLAAEILEAMAEGLPTLVAVPAEAVDAWMGFCGGLGVLVAGNAEALWRWWGPHRLYRDLALGVGDAPARRVVVGLNWTLVEGPQGCGLAQTPNRDTAGCRPVPGKGALAGRPLDQLAALIHSWDPFEAAIGTAAVNAHYNRYDLEGDDGDGLASLPEADGPTTVVGRFPGLAERLGEHRVIERRPGAGEVPEAAAGWLLPQGGRIVVTAAALADHSLPGLLASRGAGTVALVGPGTPLSPRLHAYGIAALAGMVVEDPEGAATAVAEGGAVKALRPHARRLTLKA